jgi:hypothetical protein
LIGTIFLNFAADGETNSFSILLQGEEVAWAGCANFFFIVKLFGYKLECLSLPI